MWRAVERWGSQIKSGLNFDFLSRLFGRSKPYSQFESTEDIFSDAKEELLESDEEDDVILMRDSDPYEVTYERRRAKVKGYGASSEYDVQIHTDSSGAETGLTGHTMSDHCNGDVHVECTAQSQSSSVRIGSGHHRQGSSVREEVGELVTSVFQRQYNKFENDSSDEDHSSRDQDHNSVCDSAKEPDSNSNVFHSIKDVNPNWKAKKPKRRKKVRVFQFLRRITSFASRDQIYARTK